MDRPELLQTWPVSLDFYFFIVSRRLSRTFLRVSDLYRSFLTLECATCVVDYGDQMSMYFSADTR